MDDFIARKKGNEGTDSVNIAKIAKENPNYREHLIIVTDGSVSCQCIDECDKFIAKENIKFKFVSVYLIGRQADKSVGAPFCRNSPNKTVLIIDQNNRSKISSLTNEDINQFNWAFH